MSISSNLFFKGELKTHRFVIPYRIYGKSGDVLICVNGIQQSMAMWHSFVRRFSKDYKIILFNFPSQGKGRIVSGSSYVSLEEQIEILDAVIKAGGIKDNFTICSASASYAAKYSQRVKKLILASLGSRPNEKMIETIKKGAEIPSGNRTDMAKTLIESFGQDLPDSVKSRIISQFKQMSQEELQAFYQHGLFVISTSKISNVVDLSKIKCRTILLNGEKDTIIDLADVKFLASQIPNSEIRIIKGVGHFLHLEREELLDVYANIFSSN
jgi:pimeloyl-ACP methyl ester carboxylesterase